MRRFAALFVFVLVGCGGGSNPTTPAPVALTQPAPSPTPAVPTQPLTNDLKPPAPATGGIVGAVALSAKKGETVTVGYVEIAGTDFNLQDFVGMPALGPDDGDSWAESDTHKPRKSAVRYEKGKGRYEHTVLPPGTYVVYAIVKGGPTTWAKVELKAGETVTRDLSIEGGKGGAVEVAVPADFAGEVQLGPSDLAPGEDKNFVVGRAASALRLGAKADKGMAVVTNVPPGKYTLFTVPGLLTPRGTVEVKAGETAKAEITSVK